MHASRPRRRKEGRKEGARPRSSRGCCVYTSIAQERSPRSILSDGTQRYRNPENVQDKREREGAREREKERERGKTGRSLGILESRERERERSRKRKLALANYPEMGYFAFVYTRMCVCVCVCLRARMYFVCYQIPPLTAHQQTARISYFAPSAIPHGLYRVFWFVVNIRGILQKFVKMFSRRNYRSAVI